MHMSVWEAVYRAWYTSGAESGTMFSSSAAGLTTGLLNTKHALLPIPAVIEETRGVNTTGRNWNWLKTSIGQPDLF